MVNETILAIIIAFAISAALCPVVIPFLHRLKFGQQVRDDGPQSHLKKQGTPTMGGLIILTATVITSLFYIKSYPRIIPILFVTVGFGIIGFLDDYIKIVMKRSEGLNPIQKLIGQFIITGIFTYYLMTSGDVGTGMLIPFTGGFENGYYLNLGWLFVPAVFFIVLGTDNGVNFTDGLDGLCTSVPILVATFFTVVAIGEDSGISGLQVRQTVAGLTPREKKIMELRYLKGKTQMEVAKEIGISQAQVSRLEKAALGQFRTGEK